MAADHLRWHAYAKAEPCAIVEYGAQQSEWGMHRRAFCGNRLPFDESDTLHTLASLAPACRSGSSATGAA